MLRKTARMILETFSFWASLRMSARMGMTPYLGRKHHEVNAENIIKDAHLFSLVAKGTEKLRTQRQKVSWYLESRPDSPSSPASLTVSGS